MTLWVQVDTGLPRHRKLYRLADLLREGADDQLRGGTFYAEWQARALAFLVDFWAYAAEHHPSGDITDAHVMALQDAVQRWVHGTSWAHKDPREILSQSGFVDVTRRGRMTVHAWDEWTGTELLRLAEDRKRKRLARAKASKDRPRTVRGRGAEKKVLEKMREDERREEETRSHHQQKKMMTSAAYVVECVTALNSALRSNPHIPHPREIPASTQAGLVTWEADGIPLLVATKVIEERTLIYRPAGHNRQPSSLRYFDAAVREAHERGQAVSHAGKPGDAWDAAAREIAAREAAEREALRAAR